jgi:hypothetical protein
MKKAPPNRGRFRSAAFQRPGAARLRHDRRPPRMRRVASDPNRDIAGSGAGSRRSNHLAGPVWTASALHRRKPPVSLWAGRCEPARGPIPILAAARRRPDLNRRALTEAGVCPARHLSSFLLPAASDRLGAARLIETPGSGELNPNRRVMPGLGAKTRF